MLPSNHFVLFEDRAVVENKEDSMKIYLQCLLMSTFLTAIIKEVCWLVIIFLFMIAIKIMRHLLSASFLHTAMDPCTLPKPFRCSLKMFQSKREKE